MSQPVGPWNGGNYQQFGIPTPEKVAYTYVASGAQDNDDVATATYYGSLDANGNRPVLGVLTYLYVGSTNNILSITRTT